MPQPDNQVYLPITKSSLTTYTPRPDTGKILHQKETVAKQQMTEIELILSPFLAEVPVSARRQISRVIQGLLATAKKTLESKIAQIVRLEEALEYFQSRYIAAKRKLNQLGRNLDKLRNFDGAKSRWDAVAQELSRKLSLGSSDMISKKPRKRSSQRQRTGTEQSTPGHPISLRHMLNSEVESPSGYHGQNTALFNLPETILEKQQRLQSQSESSKAFQMKATAFRNFQKKSRYSHKSRNGFDNSHSCHDNHLRGANFSKHPKVAETLHKKRNLKGPFFRKQKRSLEASRNNRDFATKDPNLQKSEIWRDSQATNEDLPMKELNCGLMQSNQILELPLGNCNLQNQRGKHGRSNHNSRFEKVSPQFFLSGNKTVGYPRRDEEQDPTLYYKNCFQATKNKPDSKANLQGYMTNNPHRPSYHNKDKENFAKKRPRPSMGFDREILAQSLETPNPKITPELDLNSYLNFERDGLESAKMGGVRSEKAAVRKKHLIFQPLSQNPEKIIPRPENLIFERENHFHHPKKSLKGYKIDEKWASNKRCSVRYSRSSKSSKDKAKAGRKTKSKLGPTTAFKPSIPINPKANPTEKFYRKTRQEAEISKKKMLLKKKTHFMSSGTLNENFQQKQKWGGKISLPSSRPQLRKTDRFVEKVEIGGDLIKLKDYFSTSNKNKETKKNLTGKASNKNLENSQNQKEDGKFASLKESHPSTKNLEKRAKKKKNLLSEYVSEFSKLQAQHLLLEGGRGLRLDRRVSDKELSFNRQMSKIHSAKIINLGTVKSKGAKRKSRKFKSSKHQGNLVFKI